MRHSIENQPSYSFGHTAMWATGETGTPVINVNYTGANKNTSVPGPAADAYLNLTIVPALQDDEFALTLEMIPGLGRYYSDLGFLPTRARLIQIPTVPQGSVTYGYPATDAAAKLLPEHIARLPADARVVSTFHCEYVQRDLDRHGLRALERPPAHLVNNKASLRGAANDNSFDMLPGAVLSSESDLHDVVSRFGNSAYGVWLKFPTGSGGDLVYHVAEVSEASLREGIATIRRSVHQSFVEGDFGMTGSQYWPEDRFAPEGLKLVAEADARNLGTLELNGSTQLVTTRSGGIYFKGHYRQETSALGEYQGNSPLSVDNTHDASMHNLIWDQVKSVGAYNQKDNGYFGIQGVDWFLIRLPDGTQRVYVVELNARPTANTPPQIMADKIGAAAWLNINATAPSIMTCAEDYIEIVGRGLAFGEASGEGLVVPQAFRSIVTRDNGILASDRVKLFIAGRDDGHINGIRRRLSDRGFVFV